MFFEESTRILCSILGKVRKMLHMRFELSEAMGSYWVDTKRRPLLSTLQSQGGQQYHFL